MFGFYIILKEVVPFLLNWLLGFHFLDFDRFARGGALIKVDGLRILLRLVDLLFGSLFGELLFVFLDGKLPLLFFIFVSSFKQGRRFRL